MSLCYWLQGIELKQAAANPLLGQFHLQDGGRFVKAKLPSASMGRQGTRLEKSYSVGSGGEPGVGAGDDLANANAPEQTGSRGGSPRRHGNRWEEGDSEVEDLGGPPAA